MAFEFHLPDIGEGVIEGEVVEWLVGEGDTIELDAPMVSIQTDKATVEIPSPRKGVISKINFKAGEVCPVGDVLVVIAEAGVTAAAAPVRVEVPAPAVASGNGHGARPAAPAQPMAASTAAGRPEVIDATGATRRVLATPATRRLARELGVDITQAQPTGKAGRVTPEDVRALMAGGPAIAPSSRPRSQPTSQPFSQEVGPQHGTMAAAHPAATAVSTGTALARPDTRPTISPMSIISAGAEERIPFRGVRRKIAENMARSKFTATHFTYVEEVDMTDMVELRDRARQRATERGVKLTYLPFIIKAVCAGLKKWPTLNSSLDEERQELVRKHYYHIGLAAQGPEGLMVTVVRDADRLSIFQLAGEIQRLAEAVQSRSIQREELVGSTFTISSLGALGGLHATPIINFPEAGILGVHKIAQRPMVVDGAIVPRWMMNLSISLDHRIVDGWDGAMFLQDVKALLEDPTLMFMEMV